MLHNMTPCHDNTPAEKVQAALAAVRCKGRSACTASELAERQARECSCAGKSNDKPTDGQMPREDHSAVLIPVAEK